MPAPSLRRIFLATLLLGISLVQCADAKPAIFAECATVLRARHAAATSIIARLHVTLHDQAKSKNSEFNGAYLLNASGDLRFRLTAETGQLLLDMGMRGEKVELCIPIRQLYLSGSREELLNHPNCQLTLLARCGLDLFFPAPPPMRAFERSSFSLDGRIYSNVAEASPFLPRYTSRLTIDPTAMVIDQTRIFQRGGACAGSIQYSRYVFPEARAPAAKPVYPARVSLHLPRDAYVLDLDVEDFTINTLIAPAKFLIPVPAGCRRETLAAALEQGSSFWDQ